MHETVARVRFAPQNQKTERIGALLEDEVGNIFL